MSGVITLTTTIDTREFEQRLAHCVDQIPVALANSVNSVARAAKHDFLIMAVSDAVGGGIGDRSHAETIIRKEVRRIQSATPARPTAIMRIGLTGKDAIRPAVVRMLPGGRQHVGQVNIVSTFSLTGGGSAPLANSHMFAITGKNGGRVILVRTRSAKGLGKAAGRSLGKDFVKAIYAETAPSAFRQEDSKPRMMWNNVVETRLGPTISRSIDNVLKGNPAPPSTGAEE